jgi:16S rRNA (cytosine1402-N4)-methyltransferase
MLSLAVREESPVAPSGPHRPVLFDEVMRCLAPQPGATLVDGTLGPGGHAEGLLERIGPEGRLYGIDRDTEALELARRRLERFGPAFVPLHGVHEEMRELLADRDVGEVDGILLDLGVSSLQLDEPRRGFSFRRDGPLDMRMDPGRGCTAADLLTEISEADLARILHRFGEERQARAIARAIVRRRTERPIGTTGELARLVEQVLGPAARRFRIHPATRTFQALRIAVNGEIEGLERLVEEAVGLLRPGGRLAVIAYHSLEDRAVKRQMRALADRCVCPPKLPVCGCGRESLIRLVTTRPVRPAESEIRENPRSRSARLRVAERLA